MCIRICVHCTSYTQVAGMTVRRYETCLCHCLFVHVLRHVNSNERPDTISFLGFFSCVPNRWCSSGALPPLLPKRIHQPQHFLLIYPFLPIAVQHSPPRIHYITSSIVPRIAYIIKCQLCYYCCHPSIRFVLLAWPFTSCAVLHS